MSGRHPSMASILRHGTPMRCRVAHEVAASVTAEANRSKRSVAFVMATILTYWHDDMVAEQARQKAIKE